MVLERDAAVSICARGAKALREAEGELLRIGGRVHAGVCDVADGEALKRHVEEAAQALEKCGLRSAVMVDCSHANSGKDASRQPSVAADVARRIAGGERSIFGLMIESFLVSGRQDHGSGQALTYGQSITDSCLGWDETEPVLSSLAEAVRFRRVGAPSVR